jgi:hypothetical protein
MGSLTPNVPLIYERVGDITYSRRAGEDPSKRTPVGWDYNTGGETWPANLKEDELWRRIRDEAKDNPLLQEALDRVKILYHLSKEDGK